jgi:hypothetical protein
MYRFLEMDDNGSFRKPIRYRSNSYGSLTHLNDAGVSFEDIAKIIRREYKRGNFKLQGEE